MQKVKIFNFAFSLEMGGNYGIQLFVGNLGAIIFTQLCCHIIDVKSNIGGIDSDNNIANFSFTMVVAIYIVLKLLTAFMIIMIQLDFKPPGGVIYKHNFAKSSPNGDKTSPILLKVAQMKRKSTFEILYKM